MVMLYEVSGKRRVRNSPSAFGRVMLLFFASMAIGPGYQSLAHATAAPKVPGDYTGEGWTDLAVWRASDVALYLNDLNGWGVGWQLSDLGEPGDVPISGDWDGDGISDQALYRPSTNAFIIWYSTWGCCGNIQNTLYDPGAIPVPGDYDGDGKTDVALFDPSYGNYLVQPSSEPGNSAPYTQLNRWGLVSQRDMNAIIAECSSSVELNTPRRKTLAESC
jgi:hypothetical protein